MGLDALNTDTIKGYRVIFEQFAWKWDRLCIFQELQI